jgi:UDP-N-acetylglucosamine transferase subunit ALG13
MIFVTVGTSEPFDRLLRALGGLETGEELVVQRGVSAVDLPQATCVDFLPYPELVLHLQRARVVVMHAGAGSVIAALANGKQPIVVPRLRVHREAVDDHQVAFGRRLHEAGLVRLVEDPADLASELQKLPPAAGLREDGVGTLAADLKAYLTAAVAAGNGRGGQ